MEKTNDQYLLDFLNYLEHQKRFSKHTSIAYKHDLEQFFDFVTKVFGSVSMKDINSIMVRDWLMTLKKGDMAHKSLHRKIAAVRSFFKLQLRYGYVTNNPAKGIALPKIAKRLPTFIESKELHDLFHNDHFADDWEGKTERIIVQLFYETGIRVSELVALSYHQIDVGNRTIKVVGKGNKERIIPLMPDLLNKLKDYQEEKINKGFDGERLIVNKKGKPLVAKTVYLIVRKNLAKVSLQKKKSPHVLRHSFATHLMNNGAELNAVKELLGHSSLAATQVYTHNSIQQLKKVYERFHPQGVNNKK
ncbi:MAG: tyrosine-type recombinase/integrase [Phycisphaerales bacterium]|nr:tyrosine-type recombinase/integrase [Phycisphaerales bacterium]